MGKSVLNAIGSLNHNRFNMFKDLPISWPKANFRLTVEIRCKACKKRNGKTMGVFVRKYERTRSAMLDLSERMQKREGETMGVCAQAWK